MKTQWIIKYLPRNGVAILADGVEVAHSIYDHAIFFSHEGQNYVATTQYYGEERIQLLGPMMKFDAVDATLPEGKSL